MADIRLMTPEEMQASRNPAAKESTETLKTPEAYGLPTLQKLYTQLYNEFFKSQFKGYPEMVDFTFGESEHWLGRFLCKTETSRDEHGQITNFTYEDPKIEFSNSFDLSPFELANVMAHEMIHLAQAVWAAGQGMRYLNNYANLDAVLGHGNVFNDMADEINETMDLNVTAVCDVPSVMNKGQANTKVQPQYFILVPGADGTCAVISVPVQYLHDYIIKLHGEGGNFKVIRCKDGNFIKSYGHKDEKTGRKVTVPISVINDYIHSGIFQDYTDDMIRGALDLQEVLRANDMLPDEEGEEPGKPEPAEPEPAEPEGEMPEDTEEDDNDYLMVVEHDTAGLLQVNEKGSDAELDATEFAAESGKQVYMYGVTDTENPLVQDGQADSGTIEAAVKQGILIPLYVILPNGCKMQMSR
jgi:hypothetical protein